MHEYYKRNQKKYIKQLRSQLNSVSGEIEQAFHAKYFEILAETEAVYINDFLEDMPYIGGNNSTNTQDLTNSCIYAALYQVGKEYGVSVEIIGKIANDATEKLYGKMPSLVGKLVPKILNMKFGHYILKLFSQKTQKTAALYKYSWLFLYEEPDETYSHKLKGTRCGTCMYFKEKNIEELIPYMCNLDYVIWGKMGIPLHRENALGYGDTACTMYVKRNGEIPDVWPPHGLRQDGLK